MIGKQFANFEVNALLVVLSGVLSNPVARHVPSAASESRVTA